MLLYPHCSQDLLQKNHMCCISWEKEISGTKCLLWNDGNWYYSFYHLTSSQLVAKDFRSWSIRFYNLLEVKRNFKKNAKRSADFLYSSEHAISYSNWRRFSPKLVKNELRQFWQKKNPLDFCKNSYSKNFYLKCSAFFELVWKQNISRSNKALVASWNTMLHSRSIFPTAHFFLSLWKSSKLAATNS